MLWARLERRRCGEISTKLPSSGSYRAAAVFKGLRQNLICYLTYASPPRSSPAPLRRLRFILRRAHMHSL